MLTARLDEAEAERLERRLEISMSHLIPGSVRGTRDLPGEQDAIVVPRHEELAAAAADLLEAAKIGVQIAPQTESRPLFPLYEAAGLEIPASIKVDRDEMGYEYYLVELSFSVMLPQDQRPLHAAFAVHLDDDIDDPGRRLRSTQYFPDRENVELFRVDLDGAFGLDAGMRFTVPELAGELLPFGKIDAHAKLKAGIVAGPFKFPFRMAKIEVAGESDQDVIWRYNMESALWGNNDFKSVLVLKIAREARRAELGAALSLVPYKRKWALFKERLPELKTESSSVIELATNPSVRGPTNIEEAAP
jgi:hypothetical protein